MKENKQMDDLPLYKVEQTITNSRPLLCSIIIQYKIKFLKRGLNKNG